MKTLTVVFVIFSVVSMYVYGVLSQHVHHAAAGADLDTELFTITVKKGTKKYQSWVIDGAKRRADANINNIAKAMIHWGHNRKPPQSSQHVSGTDYQGLNIVHRYNIGNPDENSHILFLAKCDMTNLGYHIIRYMAETLILTSGQKEEFQGAIRKCPKPGTT